VNYLDSVTIKVRSAVMLKKDAFTIGQWPDLKKRFARQWFWTNQWKGSGILRFRLSADDLVFLLDARIVSLFSSRGVSDGNYERKQASFLKRGIGLGLLDDVGKPNVDLAKALAPIVNNRCEVSNPYPFNQLNNIRLKCTFFLSDEGTTFAKDVSYFRRYYEIEFMETAEQIRETQEFELVDYIESLDAEGIEEQ